MADFHFLRPYWFVALVPLIAILWSLRHLKLKGSGWHQLLPAHLAQHLVVGSEEKTDLPLTLIALGWVLSVTALAGPTWQQQAQPVYQTQSGKVIVLDLSMSMRSDDIKPDRLTMARFKAIEIARQVDEGDLGLIGYAGDAFTISPLTPDNKNIINQIPSLSPEIMPVMGSNAVLALTQAVSLLSNAGYQQGDIFWITDGIHDDEFRDIQKLLADKNYRLLTLGVGTDAGAPIKLKSGELLKDRRGSIVVPKLEPDLLVKLSQINQGDYQSIRADDADINALINQMNSAEKVKQDSIQNQMGDQWQEAGPYLVLALLPLAAYAFRKGLVYLLVIGFLSAPTSFKVSASGLDSVFKTDNQQAYQALENEDFEAAAKLAQDQKIKAAALFKQGDYEAAIEAYQDLDDADSLYNRANAYANLGKFDDAIATYDKALEKQPDLEKAKNNKALAEKLKQQQQQQNSNQSEQNQDQQNQDQDKQNSQDSQQDQSGSQQNSQSQKDNAQQDSQNQSSDGEQSDNQQNSEQQGQQGEQSDEQNKQDHRSAEQMANQQKQDEQNSAQQAQAEKNGPQQDQQQTAAQPQNSEQQQQAESEQMAQQQQDGQDKPDQEAQAATQAQLTPEQRAEQEQNEIYRQLLNKVEDDPSYLIRRKMQLEYEKRRRSNAPAGVTQSW